MKAWKILRKTHDGTLRSFYIDIREWEVTYIQDVWVYPKKANTKLFCFHTEGEALEYFESCNQLRHELWEVEVDISVKHIVRVTLNTYKWEEYWKDRCLGMFMIAPPFGTIGVDRIKLVKQIHP